eukprot:gene14669-22441_t
MAETDGAPAFGLLRMGWVEAAFFLVLALAFLCKHFFRLSSDLLLPRAAASGCRKPGCLRCTFRGREQVAYFEGSTLYSERRTRGGAAGPAAQRPTVLWIDGLAARPVWPLLDFFPAGEPSWVAGLRALPCAVLVQEALATLDGVGSLVESTDDPDMVHRGVWDRSFLVNQGVVDPSLALKAPRTWSFVEAGLRQGHVISGCAFGNVFFSRLTPSRAAAAALRVTPHFGATNARIRYQFPLSLPRGATLSVDHRAYTQSVGEIFLFDDSHLHCVDVPQDVAPRIVLIIDLWHPDLTQAQRDSVRDRYPPMTDEGWHG